MTGFALIGAGTVAHLHARAVKNHPGAELCGAYDRDAEKLGQFVGKYGGKVYASVDALLADPKVEVVYVLTPTEFHVEVASECLRAGKHVLVEKPVATNVADITALQELAAAQKKLCIPDHNYIYSPELQRTKRLITDGSLGEIASFWMMYNIFHSNELIGIYGGILRAVGVHHAYSLLYLLGRPARLSAIGAHTQSRGLKVEDQMMITAQMPSGAIANLWASFAASDPTQDPWSVHYKVLGSRGGISYSWNNACFTDDGGPAWGINSYVESFANFLDHFITKCLGQGAPPLSTLDDAKDALRLVETAEESIHQDSRLITVSW